MSKKIISILIPVYNEEEMLPLLCERLLFIIESTYNYDWEVLFVNDGSSDTSLNKLYELRKKDSRINFLDLSRNYGKEVAMLAGFDYVTGDCTIIMDADLQHPPELITEMLEWWEKGYDDVYAKRIVRGKESKLRKAFSMLFYKILNKINQTPVQQNVGDFRLLDKKCIKALKQMRESQRYTKGMYSWIGFRKKEIAFEQQDRVAGTSKWNFWKLFNLAVEGITSSSILPLRFASVMGISISFLAFTYMIYVFIRALLFGDPVQGYPTLITVILFLGGIQLLFLGVIGEYLGRIFLETKQRPPYFVQTYNGIEVDEKKDNVK